MFDQNALNSAWSSAAPPKQQAPAQKKKGPGGIAGFLVNSLPAIGGGLGAIAGIPGDILSAGAASVAGGAAGAGLGEAIKRKILGENLDPKQIAIQAAEGGATAGIGSGLKAASGAAKTFVNGGTKAAETAATKDVATAGNSFMKNLVTQGQQAQGRVSGISAGSKIAGKELTPQDTARMLDTLKTEGIKTGNANNTLRDVTGKLQEYGKQISGHFKDNSLPLQPNDTKQISENFVSGLKTTDPAVLEQAQIIANDLQKNVKSTKDLWNFRKTLDSKIPDAKFMDAATSNKITALKAARQYITNELGDVPGMNNYHGLAEIKPFLSAEAKRLNNPGGGIVGRVLSSGPVQAAEDLAGKATEAAGKAGSSITPAAEAVATAPSDAGFLSKLVGTGKSAATLPFRAAATPVAYPGKSIASVGKQEIVRGFGVPASVSNAQQQQGQTSPQEADISNTVLDSTTNNPDTSNDPFAPENVQANVQAILQQGGKMSDVSAYLANVKAYQALTSSTKKPLNATQQQQANNATSGLQDIQSLSDMLAKDPSLMIKGSVPGGSIAQRLTGSTDYAAARNNVIDVISRLRSGAAITASEEKLYKSLLPSVGDTVESANNKLSRLSELLGSFAQPSSSGSSDIADLLANAGE